jgi:hypothetical protein
MPGPGGACPQYDRPSGLCRLQRDHGDAALPASCHHFPRRARIDERGTAVTLSLYCPTAAALLFSNPGGVHIVDTPQAFPAARGYEGLDATGEWPPLLRPDALFDMESFALWEAHLVHTLGAATGDTADTLSALAATAEQLRAWRVDEGSLLDWTTRVLVQTADVSLTRPDRYGAFRGADAFARVTGTVPAGLEAPDVPDRWQDKWQHWVAPQWAHLAPFASRFLAAHAFASWTAYQSRGVRAQIAELYVADAVLRVECVRACVTARRGLDRALMLEAVRQADLLLVHLADRDAVVAWLSPLDGGLRDTR